MKAKPKANSKSPQGKWKPAQAAIRRRRSPIARQPDALREEPTPYSSSVSQTVALKVVELFAGVGGFRVGLEAAGKDKFQVIWSNQWEPSTKIQHASKVYEARFGATGHCSEDIAQAVKKRLLPEEFDLLVGGFPCQDYSVARTLNQAAGIHGKKGVLWWEIHKILEAYKPKYGLFENVDRLLKSPAKQRGRDFAVMLASLAEQNYDAEWRVINSAEYGFPQRRKRVFILVYRSDTALAKAAVENRNDWLTSSGILANALPCKPRDTSLLPDTFLHEHKLTAALSDITESFNLGGAIHTPFEDAGLLINGIAYTMRTVAHYKPTKRDFTNLGSILQKPHEVPESFYVSGSQLAEWERLKGSKNLIRKKANGVEYRYSEGKIAFPDLLDRPSRTIVTGEGGSTPSRFKHLIQLPDNRWRRLTPVELERLNGFPDDHTKLDGITDTKRAFFMGNALVTGIVTRVGVELAKRVG